MFATAGMIAPPVVVLSKEPEAMFDIAKEVEVAPASEVSPDTVRDCAIRFPSVASCEKRLVDDAVVEKRLVVVALLKILAPVNVLVV